MKFTRVDAFDRLKEITSDFGYDGPYGFVEAIEALSETSRNEVLDALAEFYEAEEAWADFDVEHERLDIFNRRYYDSEANKAESQRLEKVRDELGVKAQAVFESHVEANGWHYVEGDNLDCIGRWEAA